MAMIAASLHNSSSAPWLGLEMIFATLQANVMGTLLEPDPLPSQRDVRLRE
jgi:hypothetical protein